MGTVFILLFLGTISIVKRTQLIETSKFSRPGLNMTTGHKANLFFKFLNIRFVITFFEESLSFLSLIFQKLAIWHEKTEKINSANARSRVSKSALTLIFVLFDGELWALTNPPEQTTYVPK